MEADGLLHVLAARTKQGRSSLKISTAIAQPICCVRHAGPNKSELSLQAQTVLAGHTACSLLLLQRAARREQERSSSGDHAWSNLHTC